MVTTAKYFEYRVEKPCCICGRVFVPKHRKQPTCGKKACVNSYCKMKDNVKKEVICKCCGDRIQGEGSFFCSRTCYKNYMIAEAIRKNPPLFSNCQNPLCNKELDHIVLINNGSRRYRFDKKYCNAECMGQHTKILVDNKEKQTNVMVWNNEGRPEKKNTMTKLEGNLNVDQEYMAIYD